MHALEAAQADPDIVLAAIASDGSALQFASSDLRITRMAFVC